MIEKFKGAKFYCDGEITTFDMWEKPCSKPVFKMTRSYINYLHAKELEECKMKVATLKAKIDYQLQTYGEVDELDAKLYEALVCKYQKDMATTTQAIKQSKQDRKIEKIVDFISHKGNQQPVPNKFMSLYTK